MLFICNKVHERSAVSFIQEGKTALFHATSGFLKCDDEVKDVLRYLVIEKRFDINSVDEVSLLRFLAFSFCISILEWNDTLIVCM